MSDTSKSIIKEDKPYAGGRVPKKTMAKKRKLIKKEKHRIKQQSKLDAFLDEWLKNGGNATEAALAVYDTNNRSSAASMGSQLLKKARELGRVYLEESGVGHHRMLDMAVEKAEKSKNPDWWDRIMAIAGYPNPGAHKQGGKGAAPGIVQIFAGEKPGISDDYVEDADLVEGEYERDN